MRKENGMKISVLSYSFRGLLGAGQMDVFGYLETCKHRYGLSGADIWNGFLPNLSDEFLKKVKEGLAERELELADLCVDSAHIWEDDPALREKNYQNALAHLKAAAYLGAHFVRIDAGGSRETMTWTSEQFDLIVKRYREYAQYAFDHGFKMGIENHWGPEKSWANLKKVYEAVKHPGFGVSCHIGGWAGTAEEVALADKLVAPWAAHTHIPWNICEGPLMEKLGNLYQANYPAYYSVEHHSAVNEYSEVGVQIAQVRDALDKLRLGN
jgi:hypothetical protein